LAEHEADGVADIGLPVAADQEDVRYVDATKPIDRARWEGLQDGRQPQTRFVVVDFSHHQWGKIITKDPALASPALWVAHPELTVISRAMMYCLRHQGCFHGGQLGCDSGGWYRISGILREVRDGSSRWAMDVRNAIVSVHTTSFTDEQATLMIFQALFTTRRRDKTRFQGLWEQQRGDDALARWYAARATASHRDCRILDPLRFAAPVPHAMRTAISGVFHITGRIRERQCVEGTHAGQDGERGQWATQRRTHRHSFYGLFSF
jgi:hypothetical protein